MASWKKCLECEMLECYLYAVFIVLIWYIMIENCNYVMLNR